MANPALGGGVAAGAGYIKEGFEKLSPKLDDEVTVEVVGQPGATKQDLYYLALTTAYGLARPGTLSNFFSPPPVCLMIEYDAADNWVRCTIRYRVSALSFGGSIISGVGALNALALADLISNMALLTGPKDYVIGQNGMIPFIGVGFPMSILIAGQVAANPAQPPRSFINKTVLASSGVCKDPNPDVKGIPWSSLPRIPSPNPRPTGDNRSRGSASTPNEDVQATYLIPLVFAALTDPGSPTLSVFSRPPSNPVAANL